MDRFDITVVGGGMVGLTSALLLSAEFPEARLCLIEREVFSRQVINQPSFDARSTAISLGSAEVFEALGIWGAMQEAATPILSVHVSDQGHFGGASYSSQQNGTEALGYVVENRSMGQSFIAAMDACTNLEVIAPARVQDLRLRAEGAVLQLEDLTSGEGSQSLEVFSDLVLIADGVNSSLGKRLGFEFDVKSYQQHAVIANIECSEAHGGVAYERFTSEGPLALLPLGNKAESKRCALVYTRPEHLVEHTLAADDESFLIELQQKFGYRLGRFRSVSKRHSYPLSLSFAKEQVRSSLVLLGNAAHKLHPVAGQGFNLALRDIMQLIATLKPVYQQRTESGAGVRYGELGNLQNYLRLQERDQRLTTQLSDGFNSAFSNKSKLREFGRNLGFLSLELHKGLNKEIFHRMMGETFPRAPLEIYR